MVPDWDLIFKVASFLVALAALGLSVFNALKARDREEVKLWAQATDRNRDINSFAVAVVNTGSTTVSLREGYYRREDLAVVRFYSMVDADVITLAPGTGHTFRFVVPIDHLQPHLVTIRLANGRWVTSKMRRYSRNRRVLPFTLDGNESEAGWLELEAEQQREETMQRYLHGSDEESDTSR